MFRTGAIALIVLGAIHIVVLGIDAAGYAGGWLGGMLWTWDHWWPVIDQPLDLVRSGFAFWSTVASCAVPMILVGVLLLWIDSHGLALPRAAMVALALWALMAVLLMPPSGFVLVAAASLALLFGRPRGGWA